MGGICFALGCFSGNQKDGPEVLGRSMEVTNWVILAHLGRNWWLSAYSTELCPIRASPLLDALSAKWSSVRCFRCFRCFRVRSSSSLAVKLWQLGLDVDMFDGRFESNGIHQLTVCVGKKCKILHVDICNLTCWCSENMMFCEFGRAQRGQGRRCRKRKGRASAQCLTVGTRVNRYRVELELHLLLGLHLPSHLPSSSYHLPFHLPIIAKYCKSTGITMGLPWGDAEWCTVILISWFSLYDIVLESGAA